MTDEIEGSTQGRDYIMEWQTATYIYSDICSIDVTGITIFLKVEKNFYFSVLMWMYNNEIRTCNYVCIL